MLKKIQVIVFVLAALVFAGNTYAQIIVKIAPPAPRVEVRVAPPSPAHIWIDGRWDWVEGKWAWRAGHWEMPPRPHSVWVAGHWKHRRDGYVWVEGKWRDGGHVRGPVPGR